METINFPKKKLRTPEEFQRGYMRRWWATIARTVALSLLVSALAFGVLTIWQPTLFGVELSAIWPRLCYALCPGIATFVTFFEPPPPRDAGAVTRHILERKD